MPQALIAYSSKDSARALSLREMLTGEVVDAFMAKLSMDGADKRGQALGFGGGYSGQSLLLACLSEGPSWMATKGNAMER